jgi:serine/threonine protein kinase
MASPISNFFTYIIKPDNILSLKGPSREVDVAYEQLKELESGEMTHIEGDVVHLIIANQEDKPGASVAIKVDNIANMIGKTSSDVKKLIDHHDLEKAIEQEMKRAFLQEYGLKESEYDLLKQFYKELKSTLESSQHPLFFSRTDTSNASGDFSPRSFIYIPSGPMKGFHVLLKSHGIDELGVGKTNLTTVAFCLDTGVKEAFRTGKSVKFSEEEREVNKIILEHPDYFSIGIPIEYLSSWRPRETREKNIPKTLLDQDSDFERKMGVSKTGMIMPYYPSTLLEQMTTLTFDQKLKAALKTANALKLLHDLGFVHYDLKPENVNMTDEGDPRLSDFGNASKIGEAMPSSCGAPGYMDPDMIAQAESGVYEATPQADIWSFGIIMAQMFLEPDKFDEFKEFIDQENDEMKLVKMDSAAWNNYLQGLFPEWENVAHVDNIIYLSLQKEPGDRKEMKDIIEQLDILVEFSQGF